MASAKQDRINRLVYILERANSWVSSAVLAKMLNTSERTVRNYIAEINRGGGQRVASSKEGYRLERSRTATPEDESRSLPANTHSAGGAQTPLKSVRDTRRDYALSNLLLHILVIIIRLKANNELGDHDDPIDATGLLGDFAQRDEIRRCADEFSRYFEDAFGCPIPEANYQQVVLLIALSVERYSYDELSFERLTSIIERPFVQTVSDIAKETADRYGIAPFDETFMLQFTLHMYNVYQRVLYHVRYPNPLVHQIMSDFAWGRHDVNFVLLIGIAREDMGYFRDVLDIIIELFSSVDDTMRLMQPDTFEEFLRAFTHDLG